VKIFVQRPTTDVLSGLPLGYLGRRLGVRYLKVHIRSPNEAFRGDA